MTKFGKDRFGIHLDTFFGDGQVDFQLEEALNRANIYFKDHITDPECKKLIDDLPLEGLPSINSVIRNLPEKVDEAEMTGLITEIFKRDYPKLSDAQRSQLAEQYVYSINRSLLSVSKYCFKVIGNVVFDTYDELSVFRKEMREFFNKLSYPIIKRDGAEKLIEGFSSLGYQKLFGVDLPKQEIQLLLEDSNSHFIVSLSGQGGVGKTTLADFIARGFINREAPFKNFLWINARQEAIQKGEIITVQLLIDDICRKIGQQEYTFLSDSEKLTRLARYFHNTPCLVVLDNLETLGEENLFYLIGLLQRMVDPTKFLLTGRIEVEMPNAANIFDPYEIKELTKEPSLSLIEYVARNTGVINPPVEDIYQLVGGNPLAIILTVSQMQKFSKDDVLRNVRQASQKEIFDYVFRATWLALSRNAKDVVLLIHRNGGQISFETLKRISGKPISDLIDSIRQLIRFSMVEYKQNEEGDFIYFIHSLTATFISNL